ncbi:hypothetical protein HELRODRAFT_171913 [Helobdella robusta]|uniref:Apple domain-containing protein n=1 Tax=Helobdella robusta TaxID=6412 RepID=T1F4U4_HELRO|nr:hypothetical protein HELRODRAFT_171913 [Helobdella robusta]ESO04911.1 hypothetical protein HELRODRAFT_171913 [Helobdella robusta]
MNAGAVLILNLKTIIAGVICFEKFREGNVDFCSCDPAIEDRSWSTFSFLEALMLCSMRCSQTASCVAYNFINATNQCQLFNQTLNKFSVLPGCQYYYRKVVNDSDLSAIGENLTVEADDYLQEFYINGINVMSPSRFPHAKEWNTADMYNLKGDLFVIAVRAWNTIAFGGVTISTADNYIVTNSTWKCRKDLTDGWYKINYNDSFWTDALEGLNTYYPTSSPLARYKWIFGPQACEHCDIYCRRSFIKKDRLCLEKHFWEIVLA